MLGVDAGAGMGGTTSAGAGMGGTTSAGAGMGVGSEDADAGVGTVAGPEQRPLRRAPSAFHFSDRL